MQNFRQNEGSHKLQNDITLLYFILLNIYDDEN